MAFCSPVARAALLALATGFIGSHIDAEIIDLYGAKDVTLTWAPASGPVAGYYVIVFRNDSPGTVEKLSAEPAATLRVQYGDEISVSVAAFDAMGVAGPLSARSDTLRFNRRSDAASAPASSDDDGGSPSPGPDGGDPPPGVGPGVPLDFSGDGVSDLMLRDGDGALELVAMNGATPVAREALPWLDAAWAVVGNGDYDGNGLADLLWEERDFGRLVVWGMHDGVPDEGVLLDLADLAPEDGWRVGCSGDFDGDGHADVLLFSRILGEVEIVHLRDGALAGRTRRPGYVGGAWSVATAADLDADGIDEIVWRDEIGDDLVLWHPELGGDEAALTISRPATGLRVAGAGDFDGDGLADLLLTGGEPKRLEVWRLEGRYVVETLSIPGAPDATWRTAGVGDYDADGRADLVWFDPASGGVEIWFSDGASVTREALTLGAAGTTVVSGSDGSDDSEFLTRLCDGDFNGDGATGAPDLPYLQACFGQPAEGACAETDMNSDGAVGAPDYTLFQMAFGKPACAE